MMACPKPCDSEGCTTGLRASLIVSATLLSVRICPLSGSVQNIFPISEIHIFQITLELIHKQISQAYEYLVTLHCPYVCLLFNTPLKNPVKIYNLLYLRLAANMLPSNLYFIIMNTRRNYSHFPSLKYLLFEKFLSGNNV